MWQVEQSLTCKGIRRNDEKNKDTTMQQLLYGEILNKDYLRCFFCWRVAVLPANQEQRLKILVN